MNLVDRAKNLILTPKTEWAAIDAETHTVQDLYTSYVMILAAIPPVATFIGLTLIGMGLRIPITAGVVHLVLSYVLEPRLGVRDRAHHRRARAHLRRHEELHAGVQGGGVRAHGIVGRGRVLYIIPVVGIIGDRWSALYSLYLLYLGLPRLMKAPEDKALPYTLVVIVVAIVMYVVIGAITALAMPGAMRGF